MWLGLQRCRLETFDLDDNLAAGRRPDTEMDAAIGLRLGPDRQTPDGRRFVRHQMQCRGQLWFLPEADARIHAAISRSPYGPLECVAGVRTMLVVIVSTLFSSDGTRSILTGDRNSLRMAVAI